MKCDIRKFFANIDHKILLDVLSRYIPDKNILWLLKNVIDSFETESGVGLPLGNLTSQLFVNIYLNEVDQFVKHKLKAEYYIRYCDDFIILSKNKTWLEEKIPAISGFLESKMKLKLHPDKIFIKTLAAGVDFLGFVDFFNHRILRTKTKKRMIKKLRAKYNDFQKGIIMKDSFEQSLQSYLGILKHCVGYKIKKKIDKAISSYYT